MCTNTAINATPNGTISFCNKCNNYNIEYKNLYFTFSKDEYDQFKSYFASIDAQYWENRNAKTTHKRKVIVPIGSRKLVTVFNTHEIEELKRLFDYRKTEKVLRTHSELNQPLFYN